MKATFLFYISDKKVNEHLMQFEMFFKGMLASGRVGVFWVRILVRHLHVLRSSLGRLILAENISNIFENIFKFQKLFSLSGLATCFV